jgi:hypothetical protein
VEDRAVMLHHAARRAAGAGRVDEAGEILAPEARRRRAGLDVRPRLGFDQSLPVMDEDSAPLAGADRLERDDVLAGRASVGGRKQRPRQLVVRDEDGPSAGIVHDMLVVPLGIGRVGGDGDAARGHDREVRDQPFRPVLRDQHHSVARAEAEPLQRRGHRRDLPGRLAPASRAPLASALRPEEWRVALLPGAGKEHRDEVREIFELAHHPPQSGAF